MEKINCSCIYDIILVIGRIIIVIYLIKSAQIILLRFIDKNEKNEIEKIKKEQQKTILDAKALQAKTELEYKKQIDEELHKQKLALMDKEEEYRKKEREHEIAVLKIEKGINP